MSKSNCLRLFVVTFVLALAGGSAATAADTHPVKLPCAMVISGVNLRPGDYNLHWDLQGARGTVTFSRKGRVIATVQGVVSKLDEPTTRDTLYFHKHPDGFMAITALAPGGTDKDILFPLAPERPRQAPSTTMNANAIDDTLDSPHFGERMSSR